MNPTTVCTSGLATPSHAQQGRQEPVASQNETENTVDRLRGTRASPPLQ